MIKQAPSLGRIVAMVAFALSVFGLLMFLWLAFGGPIPLKPEGYRLKVHFPEAATLAQEADVRIAGVNVGKVKTKQLDKRGISTLAELELDSQYAPIPRDSRAMLRQKTLFGETYVELTTGSKRSGQLKDGATLPNARIEPTVELDEIFTTFDPATRQAFRDWMTELARAIRGGRSRDLNDAFGNLEGFSVDGAKLLRVLDEQELAVSRLIRNTGVVFGAINERRGALRQLIQNSHATFEATASRDRELAETFRIFPTFLDESRVTLDRLERFARNTHPLVNDLKGPATDLGPTVRDLGELAPHLTRLFRNLPPLMRASRRGLPALERLLRGAQPLVEAVHVFFPELNPILAYFNFNQDVIAHFISNASSNLAGKWAAGERGQTQIAIIDPRSFPSPEFPHGYRERPFFDRGNSYIGPNFLTRGPPLGTIESFDCSPAGGVKREPEDALDPGEDAADKAPPCYVVPPSLFDGKQFTKLDRGESPFKPQPPGTQGTRPAVP
jgi:phospholipid/cholesterol/gamma-HCH transport system substrate-binding protein